MANQALKTHRILVFEWLCSGGLLLDQTHPQQVQSLLTQGQTMLHSVCLDLLQMGAEVHVPLDHRISLDIDCQQHRVFEADSLETRMVEWSQTADWVLMIAPESEGCLVNCLNWLRSERRKLLNPSLAFTELTSDKNRLQEFLAGCGIDVPNGCRANQWMDAASFDSQTNGFVLKPGDGCGGEQLRYFESFEELQTADPSLTRSDYRIEEFVPGVSVSVSVIRGKNQIEVLPALRQRFDRQPVGHFESCTDDLDGEIARRAQNLAARTVAELPETVGYFGIDMVIGRRDVVIEVNPRITMSYPMLRNKLNRNLAELMIQSAIESNSLLSK